MTRYLCVGFCGLLLSSSIAWGGPTSKAARQAAEYLVKKFGREAEEQGIDTLTRKITYYK